MFEHLPERPFPRIPGRLTLSIDVSSKWMLLMQCVKNSGKQLDRDSLIRLKMEEQEEKREAGISDEEPPRDFEHYAPDDCKSEFVEIVELEEPIEQSKNKTQQESLLDVQKGEPNTQEQVEMSPTSIARYESRPQFKILIVTTTSSAHRLEQVGNGNHILMVGWCMISETYYTVVHSYNSRWIPSP